MCQQCGCAIHIKQGPEVALRRAVAIIKELGVTADNVQAFEDGERICSLIASKVPAEEEEEIRQIAQWVLDLHRELNAKRTQAYVKAAQDVFARLPAKGFPREVITTWHQLEQLGNAISDKLIASIEEPAIRDAIRAVQHVHDDHQRILELARRYGLESQ